MMSAGVSLQTPPKQHTAHPPDPSWFQGGRFAAKGKEKLGEEGEGEKRTGSEKRGRSALVVGKGGQG